MTLRADALLFDKDGTLFEFEATWIGWARTFLAELSDGDAVLARRLGEAVHYDTATGTFAPTSVVIAGTPEDAASALAPILGVAPDAFLDRINLSAADVEQVEAVPLHPFLSRLRAAGLVLGVATNDAEAPMRAHLGSAGVTDFFDFLAGYDSGYGAKPGPGMCRAFAEATGFDPARVVMVGDSAHDLVAGRAAGMQTVAVLTGPAGRDELAPLADAVFDDIGALPDWLGLADAR